MTNKYYQCLNCGAPNADTDNCEYCGVSLTAFVQAKNISNTEKSFFDLGIYEYEERNIAKAAKIFDKILLKNSKNRLAWFYKYACEYLQDEESEDLISVFKKIQTLSPVNKLDIVEKNILQWIEALFVPYMSENIRPYFKVIEFSELFKLCQVQSDSFITAVKVKFISRYNSDCWTEFSIQNFYQEVNGFESNDIFTSLDAKSKFLVLSSCKKILFSNVKHFSDCISIYKEKYSDEIIPISRRCIDIFNNICTRYSIQNIQFDDLFLSSGEIKTNQKEATNCFIATATMGSYDHPVVIDLRELRDTWLLKRHWGVVFTDWYYRHGPKAAVIIFNSFLLKKISFIIIVKPLHFFSKIIAGVNIPKKQKV